MSKLISKTEVYEYDNKQQADNEINALTGKWEVKKYQSIGQDKYMVEYKQEFIDLWNLEVIADEIESLDLLVKDQDKDLFFEIVEKFTNEVDPENRLTIKACILKMPVYVAREFYERLQKLHYIPYEK
jgi:hypothetical protein